MKKPWKGKRSLRENLQRTLPALATAWFDEGNAALVNGASWEQMHGFRLSTKRFRYTLEIFRGAYGPGLERRIETLRNLQTLLGDMNDCVVTSEMLRDYPDLEPVRNRLAEKAAKKSSKLYAYWSATFAVPGEQLRWTRYLERYACPAPRVPRARRLPAPQA
jgi:CHAD domain-containing protein